MGEEEMGVVTFWIAVAGVLIAGGWFKARSEAQKHATLRTIIEKTGTVDAEQLRSLLGSPTRPRRPGELFAFLRIVGTIAMCVAIGLVAFFTPLWLKGIENDAEVGVAFGAILGAAGVGFFLASRYVDPRRFASDGGSAV
jgi:hypothetical protein